MRVLTTTGWALGWMAAAHLGGCALTTEHVELAYTKQEGIVAIPGAGNVKVGVQVDDRRHDKSKVSSKKNGFGMEMAPILATEDVAVTIRRAIEQELASRGFQLSGDTPVVRIVAEVTRFYNDHKMGFFAGDAVADLSMAVSVRTAQGAPRYSRQIAVQGMEPNTQLATGNNARLALNKALENGMKALFEDPAFLAALVGSPAPPVAAAH